MGKEVRILIADGNPDLRRLLAALIDREADMRAVGVTALGAEALELIGGLSPDLVLTDGNFSDMDRRDFLERLALMDEDARPAVIALSRRREPVTPEGLAVSGVDNPLDLRSPTRYAGPRIFAPPASPGGPLEQTESTASTSAPRGSCGSWACPLTLLGISTSGRPRS